MKKNIKREINSSKEMYVNGELLKFHSNIQERIKELNERKIKKEPFLNRKNRHIHFMIMNILLSFIAIGIYFFLIGRTTSYNKENLLILFSKKSTVLNNNLEFRIQIKNLSNREKKIEDYKKINFFIYDENNINIFSKEIILTKSIFSPKEYHTEYIILNNLKKGNYSSKIYFYKDNLENLEIKFRCK